MANIMLVDATQEEETRVAIVSEDDNRLQDFEFESNVISQIKGNIYLAKITRVEPSLQASFLEYGGNRQAFLPFTEIHPDYFRIPVADRKKLLEQEEQELRKKAEAEAAAEEAAEKGDSSNDGDEKPKRKRRTRKKKDDDVADDVADDAVVSDVVADQASEADSVDAVKEEKPKRKRRATKKKTDETADVEAGAVATEEAVVEGAQSGDDDTPQNTTKKKRAPRKKTTKAARREEGDDEVVAEDVKAGVKTDVKEEKPKRKRRTRAKKDDATEEKSDNVSETENTEAESKDDKEEKPKRRRRTRKNTRSKKNDSDDGVDENDPDAPCAHDIKAAKSDDELTPEDEEIEESKPRFVVSHRNYKIQEVVKSGQIMLIQINKEERGNKGAAVTTFISLPGRYCVLMPNSNHGGGVSRKIKNITDRKKMKKVLAGLNIPQGMSVIMRTAGIGKTKTEIKRDLDYLLRLWNDIREKTLKSTAPACVYEEGNVIKRCIRDQYGRNIDSAVIAGKQAYEQAHNLMTMLMPAHAKNIHSYDDEKVPLFQKYEVEKQISSIFSPTAYMPSGGYIVINPTEALVSVDVNSGRATKERHIEETALKTNLEAADEVARQLRLRDLGGLVVIDFIDMENYKNNRLVERRLKEALSKDRARVQVGRISSFGLLELSRQRLRPSLFETNYTTCPTCQGMSRVRTIESSALMVLRAIERAAIHKGKGKLYVKSHAEVVTYILTHKKELLSDIESKHEVTVNINGADGYVTGQYEISRDKKVIDAFNPSVEEVPERPKKDTRKKTQDKNKSRQKTQDDDDENDDGNKRRRRRGRRGGRRRNKDDQDQNQNNDQDNNDKASSDDKTSDDNTQKSEKTNRNRRNRGRGRNKSDNRSDNKPANDETAKTTSSSVTNEGVETNDTSEPKVVRKGRTQVTRPPARSSVKAEEKADTGSDAKKEDSKKSSGKKGWWRRLTE